VTNEKLVPTVLYSTQVLHNFFTDLRTTECSLLSPVKTPRGYCVTSCVARMGGNRRRTAAACQRHRVIRVASDTWPIASTSRTGGRLQTEFYKYATYLWSSVRKRNVQHGGVISVQTGVLLQENRETRARLVGRAVNLVVVTMSLPSCAAGPRRACLGFSSFARVSGRGALAGRTLCGL
jgi:hypothetical protein